MSPLLTPRIVFPGTILRRTEEQRATLLRLAAYADDKLVKAVQGANGSSVYCSYVIGGMRVFHSVDTDGELRTLTLHDVIDARD